MRKATLLGRRDEQGGEDPTGSTSSTDSSADWSTFDPRPESGDDSSSSSFGSDSEHDAEERQEVKDEQVVIPMQRVCCDWANSQRPALWAWERARREALERAVTYRLGDGAYRANCHGRDDDEQGLMPYDEEYSVDPRCDHDGVYYVNTVLRTGTISSRPWFLSRRPAMRAGQRKDLLPGRTAEWVGVGRTSIWSSGYPAMKRSASATWTIW